MREVVRGADKPEDRSMNRATAFDEGWCALWQTRGCSLFCPCVLVDGVMLCVPCAAREAGLSGSATAEDVIEATRSVKPC